MKCNIYEYIYSHERHSYTSAWLIIAGHIVLYINDVNWPTTK